MGQRSEKAKNDRRAAVTLQGLRALDHPKVPEEVRGDVVPWERVGSLHNNQTGQVVALRVFREDGTEVREGRVLPAFRVDSTEGSTARRAIQRRWRQLLGAGDYSVIERSQPMWEKWSALAVMMCLEIILLVLVVVGMVVPAFRGFGQQPVQVQALTVITVAAVAFTMGAFCAVPILMVAPQLRANAREMRVTNEGVERVLRDGRSVRHSWSELRRVGLSSGVYRLEFTSGERVWVHPRRTRPVFEHHRDRVDPDRKAREKRRRKRLAIRMVVMLQLGGIAGAALLAWLQRAGMTASGGPWPIGLYFTIAFGIPLVVAAQFGVLYLVRRLESRFSRKKRRRGRAAAAGRLLE